ncbi:insulin-like growth factor-binding protein complex acid labile subunit [Coccinella septempunctata]|uniref:insulin-like growth factor-binding protein complex acid labile subunit n=1 Tax=Coccinella septempunctata TaxID=41139 RepID=UPI001D08F746|nr:insulin-like growth factor-binding protein complex acid labile subunit [Coccinella septempunctata]
MFTIKSCTYWAIFILSQIYFADSYRLYIERTSKRCAYGERGSLTATCENIDTPSFFKSTPYRFDHLDETLQCLNCSLRSIEPNSFDISGNQIKHLILRNSGIGELHQRAFVGLVFVLDVDLSSNSIRMISSGTFAGIKKIESINLKNNSLALLSNDGFGELANLVTLTLSQNKIGDIEPFAFRGLKSIKYLKLDSNRINNISVVFQNLTTLEHLDLSDNRISALKGSEFTNLTSLLELRLDKNKIKSIPSLEFFGMLQLELLGLSSNLLSSYESQAFDGLTMLETLDLGNNQLTSIREKSFTSLHGLVNLNLTGNRFTVFQVRRFAGLPKLRILDLSNNKIEDIDVSGIFPLHDLHTLDLSRNNLTDLDYVSLLHRMPRVSYLSLQGNDWRCDLESDMEKYFNGENFKFQLFDKKNGSVKCNDSIPKKNHVFQALSVGESSVVAEQSAATSQLPVIFGLIFLAFAVILLSYGQYQISRELRFNPLLRRRRTQSEVKLFQSEIRDDDSDFPK